MAINTTLAGLSQTAASNGPDGSSDAPSTLDNAIQYALAFIAQLRDGNGFTVGMLPYRGFLSGLTLSTAGSSATFSVAAGACTESTHTYCMYLSSALSKTTSAWAVGTGNGGLDTGAIANSTWYHVYVIRRPDTGVVDAIFSTSASAPTLPANYTQYRRIGAMKTNGSAQWTSFIQVGDYFQWLTPVADIAATNPGSSAVTRTLTVPTGVNVLAEVQLGVTNSGAGGTAYSCLSDLATNDRAPSAGASDTTAAASAAGASISAGAVRVVNTNTSAQIRSRLSYSDASVSLNINTLGWFDRRGRDA